MKYFKFFSTLIMILFIYESLQSQNIDCSNGRYQDSIFGVTVTSNVLYGHNINYNGTARDLMLDIYTPTGDTALARPLIIFAPKGSFLSESKTELTMVQLCTHFASLGYVAVAVDYRVGLDYMAVMANSSKEFTLAVLRASHDYKAAIRYFRKDFATTNTYKIDTNVIIAGGSSAGAITALHVAYLNDIAEIPTGIDTTGLGGAEGLSGNPGYSSKVHYVVNLCGAIADTSWINQNDVPVVSMHGNLDTEVPYGTAVVSVFIPIMEVDGSASINKRCNHVNVENPFYTFWGRTHIPYDENAAGSYLMYMDTVKTYVTAHLHDWLCGTTSVKQQQVNSAFYVFPNPAKNLLTINLNDINNASVKLVDFAGRTVYSGNNISGNKIHSIDVSHFTKGIYMVQIFSDNNSYNKKVVIN